MACSGSGQRATCGCVCSATLPAFALPSLHVLSPHMLDVEPRHVLLWCCCCPFVLLSLPSPKGRSCTRAPTAALTGMRRATRSPRRTCTTPTPSYRWGRVGGWGCVRGALWLGWQGVVAEALWLGAEQGLGACVAGGGGGWHLCPPGEPCFHPHHFSPTLTPAVLACRRWCGR